MGIKIINGISYSDIAENIGNITFDSSSIISVLDTKLPTSLTINSKSLTKDVEIKAGDLKSNLTFKNGSTTLATTVEGALERFVPIKFNMIGMAPGASFYTNQCWYEPLTGKVEIFFDMSMSSAGTGTNICRVPSNLKPSAAVKNNCSSWINNSASYYGYMTMDTNGYIKQGATGACTRPAATFTYYTTPYLLNVGN